MPGILKSSSDPVYCSGSEKVMYSNGLSNCPGYEIQFGMYGLFCTLYLSLDNVALLYFTE